MSTRKRHDTEWTRLTEKVIKTLPAPARGNRIYFDGKTPGFGLRATAAGVKSFVLNYTTIDGRQRRLTIGRFPTWSATAARERAQELRREIDRGLDPLGAKQERRGAPTFAQIAQDYIARHAAGKKSGKDDARYLRKEILPAWGALKAVDIRKADVIRLVEAKAKTAPIAGNMLLSIIKTVFAWAVRVDLLTTNPASGVRPPARAVARDRYLTETEIRIVLERLDSAAMSPAARAALRLILATGQRPGEVCSMAWADIDGDLWTIPAVKSKSGRQHVVPLSSLAVEILEGSKTVPRDSFALEESKSIGTGTFAFPSPVHRGRPITRMALSSAVLNNRAHFGIPRFTPHDLRRTCATHLPCPRFIKAMVLGHADRAVSGIYDRFEYLPEKRAALEAWAVRLREIVA